MQQVACAAGLRCFVEGFAVNGLTRFLLSHFSSRTTHQLLRKLMNDTQATLDSLALLKADVVATRDAIKKIDTDVTYLTTLVAQHEVHPDIKAAVAAIAVVAAEGRARAAAVDARTPDQEPPAPPVGGEPPAT
jgi:hypothetical protein